MNPPIVWWVSRPTAHSSTKNTMEAFSSEFPSPELAQDSSTAKLKASLNGGCH
jgi:hypothetical protein